jgi:hypothetical protein
MATPRFATSASKFLFVCMLLTAFVGLTAQTSVTGQWGSVITWSTPSAGWVPTHVILLPTGKVLYVSSYNDGAKPKIWDPATGTITSAASPGYDLFCMGHSLLPDGKVFTSGGHVTDYVGFAHSTVYDPFTNTFSRKGEMNAGRWYPTNTTLANGDVLVVSGTSNGQQDYNNLPQVYQQSTGTFRSLTSAVLRLQFYPFMFLAPNGKVFEAGWQPDSRYLSTSGTGSWTKVANTNYGWRNYGSAVMYATGKILIVGGGGSTAGGSPPTKTAEVIDLNATTPVWKYAASMANARRQLNATLLPDGKVLVTGGSSGSGFDNWHNPVYAAEIWNPATNTWKTVASAAKYRGYHSFALLLPDGRVLTGGGQLNASGQANGANIQIYSPPYLFQGTRPTISSFPTSVGYGNTKFIGTPDSAGITSVSWIRLGAVTHSFDQNQRFTTLTFTKVTGGINVVFPSSANTSPPGHYLLFILKNGVPSVGKIIRIG